MLQFLCSFFKLLASRFINIDMTVYNACTVLCVYIYIYIYIYVYVYIYIYVYIFVNKPFYAHN